MFRRLITSTHFPYTTLFRSTWSYIYENINKSLYFVQTGSANVSVGATVTGTLVAAAVLGVIICWFARDKFTERTTINLYIIAALDRKSTRLNSSHVSISYAV